MKTTVILAHPWHGSFNKAIFDRTIESLEKRKKEYEIIDLNKDKFDPVLNEVDLSKFSKGEAIDPQVKKYQNILKNSNEIVFIFPIWWFDVPAILKGFIDKVMLKNFAYKQGKTGLTGLLTHVKKTTIVSTSESPTWYIKYLAGNPIGRIFIKVTLKGIGLKNVKWLNNDYTSSGSRARKKKFLEKVAKVV